MQVFVKTESVQDVSADWLVVGIDATCELMGISAALNEAMGGAIARLIEAGDVSGKSCELVPVFDVPGVSAQRLLLVGLGDGDEVCCASLSRSFVAAARRLSEKEVRHVAVAVPSTDRVDATRAATTVVTAMTVGCVGQGLYRAEADRYEFAEVTILTESADVATAVDRGQMIGDAVNLTRELVNLCTWMVSRTYSMCSFSSTC